MKLPEVQATAGFYLMAATSMLVLPWHILVAFTVAASVHELCHILALCLCGNPVQEVQLSALGAKIRTGQLHPGQEFLCTAAGPAGSLILTLFSQEMPMVALFGLCQGLFNLLPIYPMDGGRMVRSIFLLAKMRR